MYSALVGYNQRFNSVLIGWESDLAYFGAGSKQVGAVSNVALRRLVFMNAPTI